MNIVRIDEAPFEMDDLTQEEFLKHFDYKNPVKISEDTFRVDEIGVPLPAVTVLEKDNPKSQERQVNDLESLNRSSFEEQMAHYRRMFDDMILNMENYGLENEVRINTCYLFLQEKGMLEEYEGIYGKIPTGQEAGAREIVMEKDEQIEKEEQKLNEKSEKIVVTSFAGTWRTIDKMFLEGKPLFLLQSETFGDSVAPIIVDENAQFLYVTSYNGFDEYIEHLNRSEAKRNMSIAEESAGEIRESAKDEAPGEVNMDTPISEKQTDIKRFYYTFGSSKDFPYNGGWVEVCANNITEAHQKFRERFPDKTEGILNCADYYTEEQFRETDMLDGNQGHLCHETIGEIKEDEKQQGERTRDQEKQNEKTRPKRTMKM